MLACNLQPVAMHNLENRIRICPMGLSFSKINNTRADLIFWVRLALNKQICNV